MGRRNIFVILVLLVVLGLVIWIILAQKNGGNYFGFNGGGTEQKPQTYQPISGPVTVVNKGQSAPENIAVPVNQTPAGNNTSAQFRGFNINVDGTSFTPNTVIVKVGDTVHLSITALGGSYDFTQPDYGIKKQLPVGQSTPVEFQATAAGKFTFYCTSCGGPSTGPVGYVTVSP
jgi:plastocyanin domain-containing protein